MANFLYGRYAYSIQGFMREDIVAGKAENPIKMEFGLAEPDPTIYQPITEPTPLATIGGWSPYAEAGQMQFDVNGDVSAVFWTTIRGASSFGFSDDGQKGHRPTLVVGHYKFQDVDPFAKKVKEPLTLLGIITLRFNLGKFIQATDDKDVIYQFAWDYTFNMVSRDEFQIVTASRIPRPVTASGMMKRIAYSASSPWGPYLDRS